MEQIQEDLNISEEQEDEQLPEDKTLPLEETLDQESPDVTASPEPEATEREEGNIEPSLEPQEKESDDLLPADEIKDSEVMSDADNPQEKMPESEEIVPDIPEETHPELALLEQATVSADNMEEKVDDNASAPEPIDSNLVKDLESDKPVSNQDLLDVEQALSEQLTDEQLPVDNSSNEIASDTKQTEGEGNGDVHLASPETQEPSASESDNVPALTDNEPNVYNLLPADILGSSTSPPDSENIGTVSKESSAETPLKSEPVPAEPLPTEEPMPTEALPAEPEPSTSGLQGHEETEFTQSEMEEAAALLAQAAQEAAAASEPEGSLNGKSDEQTHADDLPKIVASLPTLLPSPEMPVVYSRSDVKKQDPQPSILTGALKDSGQKMSHQVPAIFIQSSSSHPSSIKLIDQSLSQPQKKTTETTDDLATLANAALGDQAANGVKLEEPAKKEPMWCDVGIIRGTSCHVMSYYEHSFSHDPEHENISADNLPDYSNSFKIELEPGTAYKFRVCAINSCGRGPWSEVSAFKTCLPGYPGAPSSIKISKSTEGAHLSWEPPSNPAGNIIEYSVCLAVRNPPQGHGDQKGQQLAFVRVYSGPHNQTVVPNSSLAAAHIDTTSKPAIIFRIAAKNEKGFGPATQVRWLQDVVASPTGGVKPMIKKEPIASGIPMKRTKLDDY